MQNLLNIKYAIKLSLYIIKVKCFINIRYINDDTFRLKHALFSIQSLLCLLTILIIFCNEIILNTWLETCCFVVWMIFFIYWTREGCMYSIFLTWMSYTCRPYIFHHHNLCIKSSDHQYIEIILVTFFLFCCKFIQEWKERENYSGIILGKMLFLHVCDK